MHPWWNVFGTPVESVDESWGAARAFLTALTGGLPGVVLREIRHDAGRHVVGFRIEVEVERPQDLAYPVRGVEPIAVLISTGRMVQPTVLALRAEFPDTPHQNWVPEGMPAAPCVDDRPWSEAVLTWTPADTVRRIQLWLSRAAQGELHDAARPLEPLFFPAPRSMVIPRSALLRPEGETAELVGFIHGEDGRVILARDLAQVGEGPDRKGRLIVAVVRAGSRPMGSLRHAPTSLESLAQELAGSGVDLADLLRDRILAWTALDRDGVRRLTSMLAIVVAFPVEGPDGRSADDLRAFVTACTAGEVGVALGVLHRNESGNGSRDGFVRAMPAGPCNVGNVAVEPSEVHVAFDAELGATMGGCERDKRRTVLVGAGSLGSQLAVNLAREGACSWTVVDEDRLLPHNLARHALSREDVGLPKALALARRLQSLLDEPVEPLFCDVENPSSENEARLNAVTAEADVIIDASASVSVGRHLSDMESPARRVSVFFNPSGTDVVVLAEASDRSVTLRDLEAQYHALLLSEPGLKKHLVVDAARIRYSGSCRALTNRIAASNAALLSAIASRGVRSSLAEASASVRVWSVGRNSVTALFERRGHSVTRAGIGGWELAYDAAVPQAMSAMRIQKLPEETGGVLVGLADMRRRRLHVVAALPPPPDSAGSPVGFERGVEGLSVALKAVAETTMHQVRYIGEWHSHPRLASTMPSPTDLGQIAWLRQELAIEGLPALMAIAGDDGRFSFIMADGSLI